jgi:hypothetical protein
MKRLASAALRSHCLVGPRNSSSNRSQRVLLRQCDLLRRNTLVRWRTITRRYKIRFQAWNKQINKRAECRCMRGHGTRWRWIKKDTNHHLGERERTTKKIKSSHSHLRGCWSLTRGRNVRNKKRSTSPRSQKRGEEGEQRRQHLSTQDCCKC